MYTIILNDGTKFEGLQLNGNNFIADYELSMEMFPASKLKGVTITIEGEDGIKYSEEHSTMKLVTAGKAPGLDGWRVILEDYTAEELHNMKIEADIEYIAMMSGVEL